VQIDASTDVATGAIKWCARQKRYLVHYIYCAEWSAQEQLPIFTAQTFRASGGGEYDLTRKTRMEHAVKCFYNAKI
jgi:hypothetical protein